MELANKRIKNIAACGMIAPNLKKNIAAENIFSAMKSFASLSKENKKDAAVTAKIISEFARKR